MPTHLHDIYQRRRILICVGSGGVGKTTTAAALALRSALEGRRALVLTIDPARRLANSLGLEALGHEVQKVPDSLLEEAGAALGHRTPGGELHAMMLDQKRAFDEVVESHANDPGAVQRILQNPVYAQISGSLAGSQEYAAMAKLHEFDADERFETIVVDTPPTAHALDFLDAPEKLTRAIDSPAIEWFRKLRSGGGWSVVGSTGAYVLKRLSKFVGAKFLDDLAVFFTEFNDILGGFRARAEETFATLHQKHVGFVLVASPEPAAVEEALFFHQRLVGSDLHFDGFVVNRVHHDRPVEMSKAELAKALGDVPAVQALGFQPITLEMASETMLETHRDLQILAAADRDSLARLTATTGDVATVPFLPEDVHDLAKLASLSEYMVGPA